MYEYHAKLSRVIDGDSVELGVDLGFKTYQVQKFRLLGIDAPELRGTTKGMGESAKRALENFLLKKQLSLLSHGQDKYGRWLCQLYATDSHDNTVIVNDWMVEKGWAVPYTGEGERYVFDPKNYPVKRDGSWWDRWRTRE